MKDRQAQGKSRPGRYKTDDTARLKFIHCSARPLLYKGTDPRSKHRLQTLDVLQQTSILEYCEANVHFVCKPTTLSGGVASREYKMRFGQFQGWTIENMVKDSNHMCSESDMFPPGSPLPVSLCDWTHTHTN